MAITSINQFLHLYVLSFYEILYCILWTLRGNAGLSKIRGSRVNNHIRILQQIWMCDIVHNIMKGFLITIVLAYLWTFSFVSWYWPTYVYVYLCTIALTYFWTIIFVPWYWPTYGCLSLYCGIDLLLDVIFCSVFDPRIEVILDAILYWLNKTFFRRGDNASKGHIRMRNSV